MPCPVSCSWPTRTSGSAPSARTPTCSPTLSSRASTSMTSWAASCRRPTCPPSRAGEAAPPVLARAPRTHNATSCARHAHAMCTPRARHTHAMRLWHAHAHVMHMYMHMSCERPVHD
eukprot:948630-Prymnesium_polylepis.1